MTVRVFSDITAFKQHESLTSGCTATGPVCVSTYRDINTKTRRIYVLTLTGRFVISTVCEICMCTYLRTAEQGNELLGRVVALSATQVYVNVWTS